MPKDLLIYEKSRPGRTGFSLSETQAGGALVDGLIPRSYQRAAPGGLADFSETDLMRHYVEVSTRIHLFD